MKTKIKFLKCNCFGFRMTCYLAFVILSLITLSCQQKNEGIIDITPQMKSISIPSHLPDIFFDHQKFIRENGKPTIQLLKIGKDDILNYESEFILQIINGDGSKNMVSSAVIKIDGKIILGTSDFSQKVKSISKKIIGLNANSEIEVELRSSPGSYLDLWIEGTQRGVRDVDGNIYKVVTIGTQTWMAENLRTTKYNNGSDIPLVTGDYNWYALQSSGYCWYDDDVSNKSVYGALYNYYAVNTGKLCPIGWHHPDADEWAILYNYLGGLGVAGGKLREEGTTHWATSNEFTTNEYGFTALPGGYRTNMGNFITKGNYGVWWTSTDRFYIALSETGSMHCWYLNITDGLSIRCLKD